MDNDLANLTIREFNQYQPCDYDIDEVLINCQHHKTGPQGIAHLVVTRSDEQLLVVYYKNSLPKNKGTEHF